MPQLPALCRQIAEMFDYKHGKIVKKKLQHKYEHKHAQKQWLRNQGRPSVRPSTVLENGKKKKSTTAGFSGIKKVFGKKIA